MNMLCLDHASVTLREHGVSHVALQDICLSLTAGQHVALLGPNGAGKSTLLKLLHGEQWADNTGGASPITWYPPSEGAGSRGETSPLTGRALSALVSAAQQENYIRQAWDLRAEDLLLTGFEDSPLLYTLPAPQQSQAVRELARKLHLQHLLERTITTLSQGQLRLLLLARALVRRPALLLLDECLDGLDAPTRQNVLRVLDEAAHTSTIVLTSHRAHTLPPWISRCLYLQEGKLFTAPPPLPPATRVHMPAARPHAAAPATPSLHPPLVALSNVTVYVNRSPVLHNIQWRMQHGEHWLLRGANGSGKSTLLRLLAGEEYPAEGGSIERHLPRCMGHDRTVPELEYIRHGIRLVSDALQASYDYNLNAEELVLSGFDGTIGLYRDFSPEEYREALYWLRRVGMENFARRSLRTLSTGQARRLFLARALVGRPDILLLDEPCSGLDAQARHGILGILDSLTAEGIHTVLVSHHGEDRLQACTHEARMVEGRLEVER
ncbi:MAG: ATP-binding cassette domain-containing protein [Desulfovibrionaceae bacterium]